MVWAELIQILQICRQWKAIQQRCRSLSVISIFQGRKCEYDQYIADPSIHILDNHLGRTFHLHLLQVLDIRPQAHSRIPLPPLLLRPNHTPVQARESGQTMSNITISLTLDITHQPPRGKVKITSTTPHPTPYRQYPNPPLPRVTD